MYLYARFFYFSHFPLPLLPLPLPLLPLRHSRLATLATAAQRPCHFCHRCEAALSLLPLPPVTAAPRPVIASSRRLRGNLAFCCLLLCPPHFSHFLHFFHFFHCRPAARHATRYTLFPPAAPLPPSVLYITGVLSLNRMTPSSFAFLTIASVNPFLPNRQKNSFLFGLPHST
jgi:hypothetical protein